MLNQGDRSASLDVLTSSSDFGRNMILTEQQQVLLSGMLVPGVTTNQAIHINMTRDASTAIDVDELSQDEQVWKPLCLHSSKYHNYCLVAIILLCLKLPTYEH